MFLPPRLNRNTRAAAHLGGLLVCVLLIMFCGSDLEAQIVFSITNLPSRIGDYQRAYVTTNTVDVSNEIGPTGGPQHWDFSQGQGADEFIRRTDVVAPTDGGNASSFPQAAYAQRATDESSGARNWSYYRVVTNEGRYYYGFVDTNSNPDMPIKIFNPPTIDLPDSIQFGQKWSRSTDYKDVVLYDFNVHFTAQASVDAYGTVLLPGIGPAPALRVNEVQEYDYVSDPLGFINYTYYLRIYYWLVPGIGEAVEIISQPDLTGPPPANLTTAGTVSRVFEVGGGSPAPYPVSDLRIYLENGQPVLEWRGDPNASSYQVESLSSLATGDWKPVAECAKNVWSASMATNAERFFRVLVEP